MRIQIISVFATLLLLTACGADSHESLADESLDNFEKMVEIMESVKDADSAKAAESEMKALAADMKDLAARMEKLGEPPADQKQELGTKMSARGQELQQRMLAAMMKIANYPELQQAMEEAQRSMK